MNRVPSCQPTPPVARTPTVWVRERRRRPWHLAARGRATEGLASSAGLLALRNRGWINGDMSVRPDYQPPPPDH